MEYVGVCRFDTTKFLLQCQQIITVVRLKIIYRGKNNDCRPKKTAPMSLLIGAELI